MDIGEPRRTHQIPIPVKTPDYPPEPVAPEPISEPAVEPAAPVTVPEKEPVAP